jgi:hypothetical protein
VTVANPDGVECLWMYEKYGVDFIREKGGWKIWKLFVGTDFIMPAGTLMKEIPVPDREDFAAPEGIDMTISFKAYSARHNATAYPAIPEPYETYDPGTGAGPEGNPAFAIFAIAQKGAEK